MAANNRAGSHSAATLLGRPARTKTKDRSGAVKIVSTWKPRGPRNGKTFVDLLCGGGGSSAGFSDAGWELVCGINHSPVAIATHEANFPGVRHECADVTTVNMRSVPAANALWISPICTEASPAGGKGKGWKRSEASKNGQRDLLQEQGHVEQSTLEKTRATFWEAIRYAELHRPEIIVVENVPDVVDVWALFDLWLGCFDRLNYHWQLISVNSAHIGGNGIPYAPQWRDRLYIVLTRKDIGRVPEVQPFPKSWCFECEQVVDGVQTWCKAAQNRDLKVGKYRRKPGSSYGQYWYVCPNGCRTSGQRARVEPFILPAAAAINWNDLGTPIGEGRLKPNTLRRIALGQEMFWNNPTVTTVAGNTFERAGYLRSWPAFGAPMPTQQCTTTDALTTPPNWPPFMFNANHDDDRVYRADGEPMTARTVRIGDGLCLPPFTMVPGGRWYSDPVAMTEPMRTQLANDGGCEALVTPPGGAEPFLTVLRNNVDVQSIWEPGPTLCAGGNHVGLVVPYYGKGVASSTDEPFPTVTTRDRFGLARGGDGAAVRIEDCFYRMVTWEESARSQTLPVDRGYVILGNDGQKAAQVGNAVSSNAAQWFGQQTALVY